MSLDARALAVDVRGALDSPKALQYPPEGPPVTSGERHPVLRCGAGTRHACGVSPTAANLCKESRSRARTVGRRVGMSDREVHSAAELAAMSPVEDQQLFEASVVQDHATLPGDYLARVHDRFSATIARRDAATT
jgi:hypothetical protein